MNAYRVMRLSEKPVLDLWTAAQLSKKVLLIEVNGKFHKVEADYGYCANFATADQVLEGETKLGRKLPGIYVACEVPVATSVKECKFIGSARKLYNDFKPSVYVFDSKEYRALKKIVNEEKKESAPNKIYEISYKSKNSRTVDYPLASSKEIASEVVRERIKAEVEIIEHKVAGKPEACLEARALDVLGIEK